MAIVYIIINKLILYYMSVSLYRIKIIMYIAVIISLQRMTGIKRRIISYSDKNNRKYKE